MLRYLGFSLAFLGAVSAAADSIAAGSAVVITRASALPVLDGELSDACWEDATRISTFTRPQSSRKPVQPMGAAASYDDTTLYIALINYEADPERMTVRHSVVEGDLGLWQDDCVEVWVRSGEDATRFHQFIVNAAGLTESHYGPVGLDGGQRDYGLRVGCRVADDRWVCELAIPLADLDLPGGPAPGELVEIKLGREDYASTGRVGEAELSTWPPRSPYGRKGYGVFFFERDNLLLDPGLGGIPAGWEAAPELRQIREGDESSDVGPTIRVGTPEAPGRLRQTVALAARSRYRLSCEARGAGGGYLMMRAADDPRQRDRTAASGSPDSIAFITSSTWQRRELSFATGGDGDHEVILGSTAGAIDLRAIRLTPDTSRLSTGRRIPVPVGTGETVVVRHLRIVDSRAVRGFLHPPIDGTLDSRGWNGQFWEYPSPGPGAGVYYRHPYGNDGLHLQLADSLGVSAIQIRGGVSTDVVAGAERFDEPASGARIHSFAGRASSSNAYFEEPIAGDRFSFFHVRDGYIADIRFFRTGEPEKDLGQPLVSGLSAVADPAAAGEFFAQRFAEGERAAFGAFDNASAAPATPSLNLRKGIPIHIIAGPIASDTSFAALGLTGRVAGGHSRARLTLQVQDPVYPRTALTTVALELTGTGDLRLVLDLPDQVLPAGTPLWLTLIPEDDIELRHPSLLLYAVPRAAAVGEALDRALLKLKGFFGVLSEPRPWNGFRRDTDVVDFLSRRRDLATQLLELRGGIEYCHWLAPDHDIVRQYYQWFYRGKLRPQLADPVLPDEPGAPEWALAARAAWLAARSVPHWWLANRGVPGGELGSGIGDDTDMYQNYIDFPMLESGGVAAELIDGARRLSDLVDRHRLTEGLNRMVTDPLHAYEEGANHVALMTRWHYGDPVYFERCMDNARSTLALTTVNAAGHRHFKSQMQGAADLRFDRATDVDGAQHPLMLHGVCEVVWYNRNPAALKLLREWGDAWLAHQMAGEYATDVEVASDRVVGSESTPYAGGYGSQGEVIKFLYAATRDRKYLRPIGDFYAAGGHSYYLGRRASDLYQLAAFDDGDVYEQMASRSPALQWILRGDKTSLVADLKAAAAEIQTFGHMYTAAEVFTDRVFLASATRAPSLAYTGGFGTRNKLFRSHGASWEGFGTDYAALVRTCRPDRFFALLYNFTTEPLEGSLRLWNAEHGRYQMTTGVDTDGDDIIDRGQTPPRQIEVVRGAPIAIALPPRQVAVIELVREERLDPLPLRADLALASREITVGADGLVEGVAHNIGSAAAPAVVVALVDAEGRRHGRVDLGRLEAPLDLRPRRLSFQLAGLPAGAEGWQVVVDPADSVPEITEGNNAVAVRR